MCQIVHFSLSTRPYANVFIMILDYHLLFHLFFPALFFFYTCFQLGNYSSPVFGLSFGWSLYDKLNKNDLNRLCQRLPVIEYVRK